jgi:hypothetical protein
MHCFYVYAAWGQTARVVPGELVVVVVVVVVVILIAVATESISGMQPPPSQDIPSLHIIYSEEMAYTMFEQMLRHNPYSST